MEYSWTIQTEQGMHIVNFSTPKGFKYAKLTLDGTPLTIPGGLQNNFVGIDLPFTVDSAECHFVAPKKGQPDVAVNGVFLNSSLPYEPLPVVPKWGWVFVILSLAAVAIGGIVPAVLAVLGSGLCVTVFIKGKGSSTAKGLLAGLVTVGTWVAVILVSLLLNTGFNALSDSQSKTFTAESYSITLNQSFSKKSDDESILYLVSKDCAIWVTKESAADLQSIGYTDLTAEEYATLLLSLYGLDTEVKTDESGFAYCSYTEEVDSTACTYLDVYIFADDAYWSTEFCCDEADAEKLTGDFLTWARTIKIGD